jgi:hypothetical protein
MSFEFTTQRLLRTENIVCMSSRDMTPRKLVEVATDVSEEPIASIFRVEE